MGDLFLNDSVVTLDYDAPGDAAELSLLSDLRDQPDIQYPAILLSNVLVFDCLRVLKSIKRESYREFHLWVELNDNSGFQNVGTIQLDSTFLLALNKLNIQPTIYWAEDNIEVLDVSSPEIISRYI